MVLWIWSPPASEDRSGDFFVGSCTAGFLCPDYLPFRYNGTRPGSTVGAFFILIEIAAPQTLLRGVFFPHVPSGSSAGFRARQELPEALLQSCRVRPRPAVRLSPRSHRRRHRRALFGCAGQNLPGIRRNPPAGPGAEQGAMHEPSRNSETPPWKLTMA